MASHPALVWPAAGAPIILAVLIVGTLTQSGTVLASGVLLVSPAGNDANDCHSMATACRTIGAAIGKASSDDTIVIASGIYTESVTLDKNLTLIGFGSDATIISGGGTQRVLTVTAGVSASVYDVAIVRGNSSFGGGLRNYGVLTLTNSSVSSSYASVGGGVRNDGTMTLNNSTIAGNAGNGAGGLSNAGNVNLNSSSVHDNQAFDGGGLSNISGATMSISNSLVLSNSVHEEGAGIINIDGILIINRTVIANNVACNIHCSFAAVRLPASHVPSNGYGSQGGGINTFRGLFTISNSTISSNTVMSGDSGGIANGSPANISNTTISGNTASSAAGIFNGSMMSLTNVTLSGNASENIRNYGTVFVRNTIVDNGGCAANVVVSLGHNLDSGNFCALNATGDLTNTNPLLGPLLDNGGPTPTHALLAGSPAINHGDNAGCPTTDQRGIKRPQAGICDIGAYEYVFPFTMIMPVIRR